MVSRSSNPPKPKGARSLAGHRVGQVIKTRWHIDGLLGVGGMAAVYAVSDLVGRRAALKILHAQAAADPEARERFAREASVARKISHPCIVSVFDEGCTEHDEPFLIMEQLEGQSLERLWKRCKQRMPTALVLRVMERTLDVLSACHQAEVIHRDLKPSNIFLTTSSEVKVLDFGVARIRELGEEQLGAGVVVGTPNFMAPEQAIGAWDQVDGRADIFAAGATMYALLTGVRLNQGKSGAESFHLAATRAAPSIKTDAPWLDASLVSLVDQALSWDKNARYPDAESMRQRVLDALGRMDDGTSTLTALMPRTRESSSLRAGARPPSSTRRRTSKPPPSGGEVTTIPQASPLPREFEVAALEDPSAQVGKTLLEAFRLIEALLSSVLQDGFGHAGFRGRLLDAHTQVSRALREAAQGLELHVFPFCITAGEMTVWEPGPPLDAVPHALYSAGVRAVRLAPGLTADDLRELIEVLMPDAARVGAHDADMLGLEQIPHVELECVPMPTQGDGRERETFLLDAKQVKGALREAIDQTSWEVAPAAVEPAAYSLKQAMRMQRHEWSRRCAEAMVDAYELGVSKGDRATAWLPLRASAASGRARGYQAIFLLQAQVRDALRDRFSTKLSESALRGLLSSVLGDEDLKALLHGAAQLRANLLAGVQPWHEVTPDAVLEWVNDLLAGLDREAFGAALDALPGLLEPRIERAAVRFIEQHAEGREAAIALELPKLRIRLAEYMVRILKNLDTPAARQVLAELASGPSVALRLLTAAHLDELSDSQRTEVMEMLGHPDAETRWASLKAAEAHGLRGAGALAESQIKSRVFHALGRDERELLIGLMALLEPERGEQLAIELVAHHGLIGEQSVDESRILAARLLQAKSSSEAALAALRSASTPLWWNPPTVRRAATSAMASIQARRTQSTPRGGAP